MGYSYPIDPSWTRDELLSVMALFQIVEKAYENPCLEVCTMKV